MRGTWHLKQPLRFPAMVTIGVWGSVMVPNKVELAFEPWSRIPSWHTDNSRIWDGVDVFSVSKHGTILRISPSSLQTIRLPSQLWILLEARLTAERLPQEHSVKGGGFQQGSLRQPSRLYVELLARLNISFRPGLPPRLEVHMPERP
jgi:hypothetical protein